MPQIEHAVIAAAGIGSRLGRAIPKCLIEIGGQTLIERQLQLLSFVPDVRVVVGYEEEAVVNRVRSCRLDATFARNPKFRETTTQDSYAIGARGLQASCLFMDGDIVFDARTFYEFIDFAGSNRLTIGVTAAKTDDAVFAVTRPISARYLEIVSFSRERTSLEWANVVVAPANTFSQGRGAVFETLQELLPAPAIEIVSYEIDTEKDLMRAQEFARSL